MTEELLDFVTHLCYKYDLTMRDMIETTEVVEMLQEIERRIKE